MYLDEAHLRSGERRNDLNDAFEALVVKLATGGGEVERGTMNRQRALRGGQQQQHRELIISFGYASMVNITDMDCPSNIPDDGTLCQFCKAEFALVSVNEDAVAMRARVTALEGQVKAAIQRGELQTELDVVQPKTPLRIEEGNNVRKRDTPSGNNLFSSTIETFSTTTAALIGVGVAAVVMILFCLWCWGFCCCFNACCGGGDGGGRAPQAKETATAKTEPTKKGWFG